jgi:hypothetical protein
MPVKHRGRLLGGNRPGSDDFSRAADKSGLLILPIEELRQAADRRLRRQRAAERVHQLGARVAFELVDHLARRHPDIAGDIDEQLARFARLDPGILAPLGGDRFPASLRVVGSGQ